jgi:hypothetical protein
MERIALFSLAWKDVEEKVPTSNSTTVLPSLNSTNSVNKWPSSWAGEFSVLLERNLKDGLNLSLTRNERIPKPGNPRSDYWPRSHYHAYHGRTFLAAQA